MNIIEELIRQNVPFQVIEEGEEYHVSFLDVEVLFTTKDNYAIFYKDCYIGNLDKEFIGNFIKRLKKGGGAKRGE